MLTTLLGAQHTRPQDPPLIPENATEDVQFPNTADGLMLSGTFAWPRDSGPSPAVLLISGSGAQDRDGSIAGHRPFLVIAQFLAEAGIAVLTVDDRGMGESEGIHDTTRMLGFQRDAEAALQYLSQRPEVDSQQLGLIGHSLGGCLATMIAASSDRVAFLVLLASPGLPGDELMLLQKATIERAMDVPEMAIAQGQKLIGGVYEVMKDNDIPSDSLVPAIRRYLRGALGEAYPRSNLDMLTSQLSLPWLVDLIRFDPGPYLRRIDCPVLALNGARDLQVPPKENLSAIQAGLRKGRNKKVKIIELPELNHLFQPCTTGLPNEYERIEITFAPTALWTIRDWINERVN